ncbi:sigma-70 family RNA polymerase sigma factor [Streptomyces sp. NPDC000410]|uniref:RNA polymerase sigma factor n=1 Tax=Streptomyces sp. NPDC000410 TaxID=3154254 RepID=UPI00331FDB40
MVGEGSSGDALRLEGGVGQRLLDIYPAYLDQAPRILRMRFPGMSLMQCQDVAQEAFLRTARKCLERHIGPGPNLMGYLLVAARNLAVDRLREDRVQLVGIEVLDRLKAQRAARLAEDRHVLRDVVIAAIEEMDDTQRRRVVDLQSRGRTDAEIADELGISLEQLRVQRHRAIVELKRKLRGHIHRGWRNTQRCGEKESGE